MKLPAISVIIPVYHGEATLSSTLRSVKESSYLPAEVIVVDDGSTDRSVEIAESMGARILATRGNQGPATARSLGSADAIGEVLLFLDADVSVHPGTAEDPGTIERMARILSEKPAVAAVFGSYDTNPTEPNFVSQWKNLTHHFVHQHGHTAAATFWAGCGAIRKSVYDDVGGFDLSYRGATIEDIELGYRLSQRGYRILLDPSVQCTHAKRWTAWSAWKTDLLYRGIPWTRLIVRTGIVPNDLNVSISQRASTALAWLMVALMAYAAFSLTAASFAGMAIFVLLLTQVWWSEPPSYGRKALRWLAPFSIIAVALATSITLRMPLFALATVAAFALAILFRRRPRNRRSRTEDTCYAVYFALVLLALVTDLPPEREILVASGLALFLLGLNQQYYAFLAAERGVAFMIAALPFQFTYHFMNGISLIAGTALSLRESPRRLLRRNSSLPLPPEEPSRPAA